MATGRHESVHLVPYGFHCAACDLEAGTKMLRHLGDLDYDVQLLDHDPYDFVSDEPPVDEDSYRGR